MKFSDRFLLMESYIKTLQKTICSGIESVDSVKFISDQWEREGGGGGVTNVIQDGSVFEKGGVNISSVHGSLPSEMAERLETHEQKFAACGLSLVIHPYSPKLPTTHMNVRYFEMEDGNHWYGGGIDLTPYYPYKEDFQHFHSTLKLACDSIDEALYDDFKAKCDEYFFIKHRDEMRGIGGIFFDYLKVESEKNFNLVKAVGDSFLPSYLPIIQKRKDETFNEADKQFQLIRRGRYVEFNLIYDRGTLFGLKTNGRIESILMSLPKDVNFIYNWKPEKGSVHEEMLKYYQVVDWVG